MKYALPLIFSTLIGFNAHAVHNCVLTVPADCEVLNTDYSASPHDTTQVVTVTCRSGQGVVSTYLTSRQAIVSTMLGFGRDFLPKKISYARWDQDEIHIECR